MNGISERHAHAGISLSLHGCAVVTSGRRSRILTDGAESGPWPHTAEDAAPRAGSAGAGKGWGNGKGQHL